MTDTMSVSAFEAKSHDAPDELRSPNKTKVEVVRLPGHTVGRFRLEPGWRWSECIKPVVGTSHAKPSISAMSSRAASRCV